MHARAQGAPWSQLTNRQGIQALHQAVLMGATLVVKHFLQMEAPTATYTAAQGQRHSPLWAALTRRQDAIAALLVQAGAPCHEADPFEPGEHKREPLVFASRSHLVEATAALLQRGINLRDLRPRDREQIIQSWLDFSASHAELAGQVFEQIEKTGWYPEGEEAAQLEQCIQDGLRELGPIKGAGIDRLLSTWRQRRSGKLTRPRERLRHGTRERS